MEITSGGTSGPRLAAHLAALDNNVYGCLPEAPAMRVLAEMFVRAGWRGRASSWTEYEVECEWACLELVDAAAGRRLCSGVVDPSRFDALATVLAGFGLRYELELWHDGTLRRELAR